MLKDLKETMDKDIKETRKTVSQQIENINKEIKIIKNKQIEILELKSTTETKKFTRGVQQHI